MDEPPQANPPIVRTDVALHDVSAAIDHILKKRGIDGLCLLGFSWGSTVAATYAIDHPAKVQKLILYAPQWLRSTPKAAAADGAYRIVTIASAHERWVAGVPEQDRKDLIPPGWFPAWADTTFAADPRGSPRSPRTLRVPNGSLADTREFWAAGKPLYDPSGIAAPTLVVNAEWDQEWPASTSYALFERLSGAQYRRLAIIGEGTRMILLERNRMQLFREVQAFLDEPQRIQDEEPQPPPAERLIPGR
jgi:pimeloyl-ACP methyl ester carboxylesterase